VRREYDIPIALQRYLVPVETVGTVPVVVAQAPRLRCAVLYQRRLGIFTVGLRVVSRGAGFKRVRQPIAAVTVIAGHIHIIGARGHVLHGVHDGGVLAVSVHILRAAVLQLAVYKGIHTKTT
jgi:hypothetical protein